MEFDIFLACAPKDFMKLPFTIQSIVDNVEGYSDIIICTPSDIPFEIASKFPVMCYTVLDEAGLPGGDFRERWRHRPNWSAQQHIKLFQPFTKDWYVTIDCDTIINRPMKFFEGDKPIWWKGNDQTYWPYFEFQERMIGISKLSTRSFIADMNTFYRPVVVEMIERNGFANAEAFIQESQRITSKRCHIGEPELYGSYCYKFHPDMYIERILRQRDGGGRIQKNDANVWSEEEVRETIRKYKNTEYDTISMHSWLDEGDQ